MAPAADRKHWLTVIMPAYRGEHWIDTALRSITEDDPQGIELLLVDGSPTSACRDIAGRYADKITLEMHQRPDLGSWQEKTNFGVQLAHASHVCWLHVDDIWLRGRAAAIRQWLDASPATHLHLSPSQIVDHYGRQIGAWRCPLPAGATLDSRQVVERLLVQNFIAAPAPVFRKDAWLNCGGLDAALWYTADWDIWLKIAASGPVEYHDAVTTAFRIHRNSLTVSGSRNIEDFEKQMLTVLDRHRALFADFRPGVRRRARTSVTINVALAAASAGDYARLPGALRDLLGLGPAGIYRYTRDSRIVERLMPRVRARMAGLF